MLLGTSVSSYRKLLLYHLLTGMQRPFHLVRPLLAHTEKLFPSWAFIFSFYFCILICILICAL